MKGIEKKIHFWAKIGEPVKGTGESAQPIMELVDQLSLLDQGPTKGCKKKKNSPPITLHS